MCPLDSPEISKIKRDASEIILRISIMNTNQKKDFLIREQYLWIGKDERLRQVAYRHFFKRIPLG